MSVFIEYKDISLFVRNLKTFHDSYGIERYLTILMKSKNISLLWNSRISHCSFTNQRYLIDFMKAKDVSLF
jgi:hypothetical protein